MVPLKGCCDTGTLKAELSVLPCLKEKKIKEEELKKGTLELQKEQQTTTNEDFEMEDEMIKLKKNIEARYPKKKSKVEGKINVGEKPKYSQSGDFTSILSSNIYFIIHIKRIGKMNPPIDRENYNVFMGNINNNITNIYNNNRG